MQIEFKWTEEISVNNIINEEQRDILEQVINDESFPKSADKNQNEFLFKTPVNVVFTNAEPERKFVEETVSFLDNYIQEHLKYEEKYMQENMYPEFKSHKEKHAEFIESYNMFKEELKLTGPSEKLLLNIETHLGQWWIHHIGKEDKLYAEFIENNK